MQVGIRMNKYNDSTEQGSSMLIQESKPLQGSRVKQCGVLSKSLQKEVPESELPQNLSSDGKYRGSWILPIVCGIQQ